MDTNATPQADADDMLPAVAADLPPWIAEAVAPRAASRPPARPRLVRIESEAEVVHWGVVALTLFTAVSILLGGHFGNPSKPKELLPVMITTGLR